MSESDSLLFSVFDDLRKHGVPLGLPEYLLLVKTLREGIGIDSVESLGRICRLLWAKSLEDQQLFDASFNRRVGTWLQAQRPAKESASTYKAPDSSPLENTAANTQNSSNEDLATSAARDRADQNQLSQFPLGQISEAKPKGGEFLLRPWLRYQLTTRSPVSPREMSRIWRNLRRVRREGPSEVLDVQGTIDNICRTGIFLKPSMQPHRRNQARLLLLIDHYGSMSAFSLLVETLISSILRGGLLGQTSICYFHDFPDKVLYQSPGLNGARPLEEVFAERARGDSVLFVSDAGSARGHYEGARVAGTRKCLEVLRNYTYLYSWLNPVPARRWTNTTAEEIAKSIPMFPLTREGLIDTVNVLRGHPFPPGIR